ncbi:MAG: 50S ribosomal protein L18e [Nanoarchaeota archaeon]|nr:50S ribosomal protein L18e [Nanoarchaeota archaeon]
MSTTNPQLRSLIEELKKAAAMQQAPIWKRIAQDLDRPSRQRRAVNISRINTYSKDEDTVVVPGKVLSVGELDHKVTIAAFSFSGSAKDKINKVGAALSIKELMMKHPKGEKVKIIG